MAKIAFQATESARVAGFDDIKANTKRNLRVYIGNDGSLKIATMPADKTAFPKNTKAVYQLDAHLTAGNKILWPTKSVAELRADLVKDKILTQKEVEHVKPGKFGNFWFDAESAKK